MGSMAQHRTRGAWLNTGHGEHGSTPDMGSMAQHPAWGAWLNTGHGEHGSTPDMGSMAQHKTWRAWLNAKSGVSVNMDNRAQGTGLETRVDAIECGFAGSDVT